jgi:hypothetical protein
MQEDDLLKEISQTLTKNKVEKLTKIAADANYSISSLIDLTFNTQQEIAFRSAWILEHIVYRYTNRFLPFVADFITSYCKQTNRSCQRHYTKILMLLFSIKYLKRLKNIEEEPSAVFMMNQVKPIDEKAEDIIETTFDWLIDPRTPVAVKANCLDILYSYTDEHDWIVDELKAQINYFLRDGTAAMQNRGKRILENLEKEKRDHH